MIDFAPPACRTWGQLSGRQSPRSFWYAGLKRRATGRLGPDPVQEFLVVQANLRGFHGAYSSNVEGAVDPDLGLEEIVTGLCAPWSQSDGRIFKLVVRMIQSGQLDLGRLRLLAKREGADNVLSWLITQVPAQEITSPVRQLLDMYRDEPVRGGVRLSYRYDFGRLVRRPSDLERQWHPKPN